MSQGGGWLRPLYAWEGGGFKQYFKTELIGSSSVLVLFIQAFLFDFSLSSVLHSAGQETILVHVSSITGL